MDKKLINEDISNMKYLFGYKPGRVISEQDIDYTTDAYLDMTELDEEGKRHPERQVRHKKTNKIVGTHKKGIGFTPSSRGEELGFEFHPTDIPHGTILGGTEVGDFDYEDDDFDFKMPPYDDEDYDELDEDMFAGWDELDNNEQDMDTGEKLYPSFSSDRKFMGMSKSMGDMETEDEDTLFEQEEPENDRYMFFSNLEQIHRQMGILLEKDPEMIHSILENGHDWAQDHIATAKESIDQVFDFIMNEEKGDGDDDIEMVMNERYDDQNGMNWVQNTTMDRQSPIDDDNDVEGGIISILKKHHLLDNVVEPHNQRILLRNQSSKVVQKILSLLPSFTELVFLAFMNCESADFSDVDICGLPNLAFVNLKGTENNFEEQGYECVDAESSPYYYIE